MSTQRRRQNRSIGAKINSIDQKVQDAQTSPNVPSAGSVTSASIVPGSVTQGALGVNSVTNEAVAPGSISTENLGTVNAVNSDSTMVLGASIGVALGGDAYTDRPRQQPTNRKSTPAYNVGMGPAGVLTASGIGLTESTKIGWVDPYYTGGYVGIYWEYPSTPYWNTIDSNGHPNGWQPQPGGRAPDVYATFMPGYEPQASDQVLLVHDLSTVSLSNFPGSTNGISLNPSGYTPVYDTDGWTIVNKVFPMPKQLRTLSIETITGNVSGSSWFTQFSTFERPRWTNTIANITTLSGMFSIAAAVPAGSIIGGMPPNFAPDYRMDFRVLTSTQDTIIQIYPDGTIRNKQALTTAMSWIVFNSIKFPAKGTPWSTDGVTVASGFSDVGGTSAGPVRYWVDPYGFCWWAGIIQLTAANSTDGKLMFSGPSIVGSHNASNYHLQAADYGGNGFALTSQSGVNGYWKTGSPTTSGATISLAQHHYPTPVVGNTYSGSTTYPVATKYYGAGAGSDIGVGSNTDQLTVGSDTNSYSFSLNNSWVSRTSNGPNGGTPYPYIWGRPDGIVWLQGFIASGTLNADAINNKAWYSPSNRMVTGAVAANATARLDILTGTIRPVSGSNTWFSLDSISYIPQGIRGY